MADNFSITSPTDLFHALPRSSGCRSYPRRDKTNLFHRLVMTLRRKYTQHLFQKATGKLQQTLRLSSQATILLSERQFMPVSCMVFIILP